ncbi:MAG: immune inhibitor A domain-containing protein, partial [Candidatus Eisenbacteria bacterium]
MVQRIGRRFVLLLLLPFLFASGAEASRVRIDRPQDRGNAGAEGRAPRLRHFPDVIGGGPLRPLLPGSGRSYADLLKAPGAAPAASFRVAVLRVEFENDSAGETTTGNGRFILEDDGGDWFIDTPPHDSVYFNTHLAVLRRYYEAQSYGRLRIEWEIFPKSLNAGEYRLHDTADYLPAGSPDSWNLDDRVDGLIRLCKDALALVDTVDPGVDFSAYDGYMIIHAGPDLQTDVNGDSPGDVPSFFLSFGGEDSVVVDRDAGDSLLVRGVTMIPEYNSQDGFLFGLNGVIAHEFGHQLGLPDLYNTEYSWPAVGVWGLMDSGGMVAIDAGDVYLGSVIPASLCAWSKLYLGWAVPEIVTGPRDLRLACATLADPPAGVPRVAMIPLNDREYFLLENRCGLAALGDYAAKLDTLNNVILGPVTNDTLESFTNDYDYALPGWGLLIWHINNRKLTEEAILYTNDVNNDYFDRAVEVEEADGIKDLGNPYSAYWDGSPYDPFFEGNATEFGPRTAPNSDLTDGGKSRVAVRGIGKAGTVMDLTVEVDRSLPGWPVPLLPDSSGAAAEGIAVASSGAAVGIAAFWTSGDSTEMRSGVTAVAAEETLRVAREDLPGPISGIAVVGDLQEEVPGEEIYAVAGGRVLRIDPFAAEPLVDLGALPAGDMTGGPFL